jgi:hypothetical protein
MTRQFDVFNGDADGICALHQWRLAHPAESTLVTGVKRDIQLLQSVKVGAGDTVTVFDISFDSNRADALRLLADGASLRWFDHHFAGEAVSHPGLETHIDTAADVCTSLIVDQVLGGRFRAWAVVAAFGDNLHAAAKAAATSMGLAGSQIAAMEELGELLNYNGYGDSVADLHFAPADLYRQIAAYSDPLEFVGRSAVFAQLRAGFKADMLAAASLRPCLEKPHAAAWMLPDAPWARRVIGVMANRLAVAAPDCAHALLAPNATGNLTVSVRAPKNRPHGADELCRRFPTGGGRKAAAGVNHLAAGDAEAFLREFSLYYMH